MFKIRSFRAISDKESSLKFAEGHSRVLTSIGIKKVSSAEPDWISNPGAYCIIVESVDGGKVYGGARIQLKSDAYPLPFEEAIGKLDPKIHYVVAEYNKKGTAELCGLWNSREVAGMGVGSTLLVRACEAKAGLVLANQLQIGSLFALCASYTLKMALGTDFEVERSVGDDGKFHYPKEDFIALAAVHKNLTDLATAKPDEKEAIVSLRENPFQEREEKGPKGISTVVYDLRLSD